MFYGKFADEGINAMDNLNIYNVEGDNMLSPGLQPKVYLKSVFLQSSYVILKVETDIIASIAASPRGQARILVTIFVEIFITGAIVFIGDVKMWLTSH
jgi:hypothetical protein